MLANVIFRRSPAAEIWALLECNLYSIVQSNLLFVLQILETMIVVTMRVMHFTAFEYQLTFALREAENTFETSAIFQGTAIYKY